LENRSLRDTAVLIPGIPVYEYLGGKSLGLLGKRGKCKRYTILVFFYINEKERERETIISWL
jgi:hypothetical protein